MAAQARMGQIEPLALIVIIHKEPERSPQRLQGPAETATATSKALEVGTQVRIETFNGIGFFFAQGEDMLARLRPEQFLIGSMAVTGVTRGWRQAIHHRLQRVLTAILADLLADD